MTTIFPDRKMILEKVKSLKPYKFTVNPSESHFEVRTDYYKIDEQIVLITKLEPHPEPLVTTVSIRDFDV